MKIQDRAGRVAQVAECLPQKKKERIQHNPIILEPPVLPSYCPKLGYLECPAFTRPLLSNTFETP
jgi:hypothetical protein